MAGLHSHRSSVRFAISLAWLAVSVATTQGQEKKVSKWPEPDPELSNAVYSNQSSGYEGTEGFESAATSNPTQVKSWLQLLNILDVYGDEFIAQLYLREALRANPNCPELILEKARLRRHESALDVIDELAKAPGEEANAKVLKERLLSGADLPSIGAGLYDSRWTRKLIERKDWAKAEEVVDKAMKAEPDDKLLWSCRALILAHQKEFAKAMEAQTKAESPGLLGQSLLENDQPKLALESFAGFKPRGVGDAIDLIYTEVLFRNGKNEEAERVLSKWRGSRGLVELRIIASLLEQNKTKEARERGEKLTQGLAKNRLSRGPAAVGFYTESVLKPPLESALRLLLAEFPDRSNEIKEILGDPDLLADRTGLGWVCEEELCNQICVRTNPGIAQAAC
jgi:tetratricopeptide (TPR) repeat protein